MNARDTPVESEPDLPLEIAHLLLIDVVGFSKLLVNEQIEFLQGTQSNRPKHRMFSDSRGKRQTHSGVDGGRDGATFFPQPGGARAMRAGN